ncbi:ABC transporter permease subunit [Eubacteriales bacterium OttesenSCG-928-K08]|nr:ABC transporter permease subunit [Eubacteriales bacterium OttesenSCG-928-K08]
MKNTKLNAIILKDLKAITSNKRMFSVMLIVPFVMVIFLPSIFILTTYFEPASVSDFGALLGEFGDGQDINRMVISLILNNIMPIFFMIIPLMVSSVMAASSFVGEKEKRTLETLLYSPLALKQIFRAKILASSLMSMLVSVCSFVVMVIVTQIEIVLTTGSLLLPDISWLVVMLLLSPSVSLIAITIIVRGSANAKTTEEAQQRSGLLVLPVILLIVGQFTGLLLVNIWMLLVLSILFAVLALFLMNSSFRKLDYETILK